MYRAFKFRIYPKKEQKELINRIFGCVRFIYNYSLSKIKENNYQDIYSNMTDYVNNFLIPKSIPTIFLGIKLLFLISIISNTTET